MKISFLKLFYEFSNSKNHNALIYNKFKFILFNLKSTTYKNLNIEYDDSGIVVYNSMFKFLSLETQPENR